MLLTDARAEHLRQVLRVEPGQIVATGTLNGLAGVSRVLSIGPTKSAYLLA